MSMSKGIKMYGYTHSGVAYPDFSAGTSSGHDNYAMKKAGKMQFEACELEMSASHWSQNFGLQALEQNQSALLNVEYDVEIFPFEKVSGSNLDILSQKSVFAGGRTISYGFVEAGPGDSHRSYVYVGGDNESWMADLLTSRPDVLISDLVLPGAHDAGMYQIVVTTGLMEELVKQYKIPPAALKLVSTDMVERVAVNLALTQKDDTASHLKIGTRFFDFRPATPRSGTDKAARHVHNFIPGAKFSDFLKDIANFLQTHQSEVVFVQITSSGIDSALFDPLTKDEVRNQASQHLQTSSFEVVDSIAKINDQKLADHGAKVFFVFGPANVNDSYSDATYDASLTDAGPVISALGQTLSVSSHANQYNVLQLQDTGSGYIANNPMKSVAQWSEVILSSAGSILQYTKPGFDNQTYAWLMQADTKQSIRNCLQPVILLNDFVDPALSTLAIELTKYRTE